MKPTRRRSWTESDIAELRGLYPTHTAADVARRLNRTVSAVKGMVDKLGIEKDEDWLAGYYKAKGLPDKLRATQFSPGHVPANKGLRRPGWAPGRMAETQFKPGERTGIASRNWRPVGTIRQDTDGYLRIKVREARPGEHTGFGNTKVWPLLQRHVWEQRHGAIPPSHVIVFRDGNRSNCAIENLEIISRADLARRNSMWTNYPRELAQAISMAGALKRKIRNLAEQSDAEQNQRSS